MAVLGLVTAVAVVAAVRHTDTHVNGAGQVVGYTPPPAQRAPVSAYFIGDSVTEGDGATDPARQNWAVVAADALGWSATVDGIGGTGFVAAGLNKAKPEPFSARLAKAVDARPQVLVVAGGRNDLYADSQQVQTAIGQFLDAAHRALPSTRIVVVGVWLWADKADSGNAANASRVTGYLRSAAATVGAVFIDPAPMRLVTDADAARFLSPDGFHPDAAGYQWIGQQMAQAFTRAGLPR